jgi:5S rRNA maturation endonuclease (ribonuclease M5)
MYKVIEETAEKTKEAIILTDFDKEGKKLYSILSKGLQKHGVKIDKQFRKFLMKNTELSCIEGITKLFF